MAATTSANTDPGTRAGLEFLDRLTTGTPGLGASTSLLVLDAVFAIGFAAGLATALSRIASGATGLAAGWLALALASATARGLGLAASGRLGARAAGIVKLDVRRRVVAAALRRRPGNADPLLTNGALLSLAVDEVEGLDGYVARFVPGRRAAAAAPLIVLCAVGFASPVSAAILALTFVPFVVLMALAGMASASESQRQFAALARLSGLFVDRIRALPVLLAYGAQERETRRLLGAALDVASRTGKVLRVAFLSSAVLEFFSALCVALVAVYAGFNLLGLLPFHAPEKLDLGRAFFVLALAPEFYAPMRRLAAAYHDRSAAQAAAGRLQAFEQSGRPEEQAPSARPTANDSVPPSVRFEDVSIRFVEDSTCVIRHLSFDLAGGQMLAIIGPSGSGKTTLLRLLLGMAPKTSGRVWIGGTPLDEAQGVATRAAWVGQAPLIAAGTVRSNLQLTAPDATPARLQDAIERSGLQAAIARRQGGIDAPIDERGGGLSGGERRRIALARALLKPSDLWLMDEPTAHLDAASEAALIATIAHVRKGRTVLVATHSERLAAIADVVVRLGESQ